ncbi:2-hydroxyacid dehydrogenase [Cryptococcus deuterogattii CA1014]|nr:2-hydroxyacid dehydrogenase [Cryptococcus deuterogattii CA1014]
MALSNAPKVLFLDTIKLAKPQLSSFSKIANVIVCPVFLDLVVSPDGIQPNTSKTREEFLHDLGTKYKDVTGIYRHFKASESIKTTGRFDEELVSKLPSSLKFIAHNGAGYDQTDTAIFLLLGAIRNFSRALLHARQGTFNSQLPLSHDPEGKVLGILGMGGIGSALARRAKPFGLKVQYHNRRRLAEEKERETGATYVESMDQLLATSDIVSLNLPLTDATKHLISDDSFSKMKPTSILINTARGPIVDEAALVRALESGKIAGCGLDVYENEPQITKELLDHPNALCLPHVGTVTVETQTEMEAFQSRRICYIPYRRSTSFDKAVVFQRQSNVSPAYISFADGYYFDLGIIIMKFNFTPDWNILV